MPTPPIPVEKREWVFSLLRRGVRVGQIERETGVRVPEGLSLTVVEETATGRYLVLPPAPRRDDSALSDQELEAAAGGDGYTGQCTITCICD